MSVTVLLMTLVLDMLVAPFTPTAQPRGNIPRVGVLSPGTLVHAADPKTNLHGFLRGLHDLGYVEGQNILVESRFADWQVNRLFALATELTQHQPDLLFTFTTQAALAAKQATSTIPIVVGAAGDLVEMGLVAHLGRPGGNITGLLYQDIDLAGKRLELLKEGVPSIAEVAVLIKPEGPTDDRVPSQFEAEARALGLRLRRVEAREPSALEAAFITIAQSGVEALMILDASMFNAHRQRILDFARMHRLPTVCSARAYAEAGCLIAYAPSLAEMGRRAAALADKILKGAKPSDLPVERADRFTLVVNLKTAQALGITMPPTLLMRADEVIR